MVAERTDTLLLNVANLAPPTTYCRYKQGPRAWYAIEEEKAELHTRWQEGKVARRRLSSTTSDRRLRRALEVAPKQLKYARAASIQTLLSDYVNQLQGRVREGDRIGSYCKTTSRE